MTDQAVTILLAVIGFLLVIAGFSVTVVIAAATIMFKIYWTGRTDRGEDSKAALMAIRNDVQEIKAEQVKQAKDILTLDFPVKLLWAKAETKLSKTLHMPEARYAEMDKLLTQLDDRSITAEGRIRLKELANERIHDFSKEISDEHRESAAALGPVMDKTVMETAAEGSLTEIELVGEKKSDSDSE